MSETADSNAAQRRGSLQEAPLSAQASYRNISCGVVSCVSACITGNISLGLSLEELELRIELLKSCLTGILKFLVILLVKNHKVVATTAQHQTLTGGKPGMV